MDEFDKLFGTSDNNEPDEFSKMFGDVTTPEAPVQERTVGSTLKDAAISVGRGALELPGMLTGLADLPIALATGARPFETATNYIGEKTGLQPKKLSELIAENYSLVQKQSETDINKVWQDENTNAVDIAKAYITNPGYSANKVIEALPSMVAGGVVSKAIMGAGKLATAALPVVEGFIARQAAKSGAGILERKLAERAITKLGPGATPEAIAVAEQAAYKTTAAIAGGAGEGIVQAGSAMDNSKGEDQRKNAIAALGSGVVDAVIGFGAGKVAQKFGFETAETAMAKSFNNRVQLDIETGLSKYGKAGKMAGGALSEGILQELPQSAQEQVAQNYADGKPLWENVNRSAVEGAIAGFAIGAGANVVSAENGPKKTAQEMDLDRRATNILALDKDQLGQSIQKLTTDIKSNQEFLDDPYKLDQKSKELNIEPIELIKKIQADNKDNQSLIDKINSGIKAKEELTKKEYEKLPPEEKAAIDIKNKLIAKQVADAQKINADLDAINKRESIAIDQYKQEQDPEKKKLIADRVFNLRKEKNTLIDKQLQTQEVSQAPEFSEVKKADEIRQEKEAFYNQLWPGGVNKDATESAKVFDERSTEQQNILDQISIQIANTQNQQKKQELQKVYDGLFQTFGAKEAQDSAEVFNATDLKTKSGVPYKSKEYLQGIISELSDPESYDIIESPDGFIGVKKVLGKVDNSSFTNEQQVYEAPQFQIDENQTAAKQETSLGNILNQVKESKGLTGQLAKFISDFIPESKLDIKVIIDPSARSASYVGGKVNTITLRDPSQLTTSIHEITHAITVREMIANPAIRDQVKLLMQRVKNKAVKEAILTPVQVELLNTVATSREYKENVFGKVKFDNVAYGLLNEYEFLAQAMGNSQFQELLKATTIADKGVLKNAWDAFVELIMKALGIKDTNKNAFGKTLKLIAQLASQENVDQNNQISNEALAIEQRLPQAEYDTVYAQKSNLLENFAQQARLKYHEIKLLADKSFGSISTRLKNVDPELPEHLRWLDFKTSQRIIEVLKLAKPILDITNGTKNALGIKSGGMEAADKSAWNWARLNSDAGKIEQLTQKYNLTEHLIKLREALNQIREDAIKVGYDVGFIDEYWPRVIKDQEGFLQATQEISQRAVFTEAFREQAKKLGVTQEAFERDFPEVKADIISNLILNQSSGIGGPGNIQSRVFEKIDPKYAKFYMDADAALMQYVYSLTKKTEARKFFGKVPERISNLKASQKRKSAELIKYTQLADMARTENPEALADYEDRIQKLKEDLVMIEEPLNKYKKQNDYTENIGTYIDNLITDGRIQKKDEKVVRDILAARFNEHGTTGIVNTFKNASYIDTMGSLTSAVTQIGDLAWAMYVGKVWTPRGFASNAKNLSKAIMGKSNVTKEDLGFERIAQEFADGTTLGKAVSKVFKMVGLEKVDSIGKEVLINNALDYYKTQAKNNPEALAKLIRPTFGNKALDVVQEILADNPTDNVKMLLYSRVLDFQPMALSEMPEFYLKGGNWRVLYMLKTFTLKQFDVFRNEVIHNIKSEDPQKKIQGITNMIQLMALLTIANAGADEIKDFMLGKETRFSDNVIENFLTMGGASRYTRMQVSKEGFGSAIAQQFLPPMKFINSASKDLAESYDNYVSGDVSSFDHARIIDSIPLIGKLYYWHAGRGEENKKSLAENDFSKATKDADLFKKQLGNSEDKKVFIEANLARFKQMKLQENFQAALNRNKAVINKLEKIPSTENVQTRLGQLKAQREQILKKYLEVAKTLQ